MKQHATWLLIILGGFFHHAANAQMGEEFLGTLVYKNGIAGDPCTASPYYALQTARGELYLDLSPTKGNPNPTGLVGKVVRVSGKRTHKLVKNIFDDSESYCERFVVQKLTSKSLPTKPETDEKTPPTFADASKIVKRPTNPSGFNKTPVPVKPKTNTVTKGSTKPKTAPKPAPKTNPSKPSASAQKSTSSSKSASAKTSSAAKSSATKTNQKPSGTAKSASKPKSK